jgi:hypothetical protein
MILKMRQACYLAALPQHMAVSLWLTVPGKFINSAAAPRTFEAQPLTFFITSPGKAEPFRNVLRQSRPS